MSFTVRFGPLKQEFSLGARVVVAADGGWRNDSLAVICGEPEPVQTLQGQDYSYWVEFDIPQHDLSEGGPYRKAQILSRHLVVATDS